MLLYNIFTDYFILQLNVAFIRFSHVLSQTCLLSAVVYFLSFCLYISSKMFAVITGQSAIICLKLLWQSKQTNKQINICTHRHTNTFIYMYKWQKSRILVTVVTCVQNKYISCVYIIITNKYTMMYTCFDDNTSSVSLKLTDKTNKNNLLCFFLLCFTSSHFFHFENSNLNLIFNSLSLIWVTMTFSGFFSIDNILFVMKSWSLCFFLVKKNMISLHPFYSIFISFWKWGLWWQPSLLMCF